MKPILLLLTSASLVLALSVALPLLGVAIDLHASRFDLASPLLLVGVAALGSSFALLARSRRTIKQVVVTRAQRCWNT